MGDGGTTGITGAFLFAARKGTEKGCVYSVCWFVPWLLSVNVCKGRPVRAPGPIGLCALRARTLPCAGSGWVLLIFALTLTLRVRDAAQIPQQSPSAQHPEREA